MNRLFLFGFFLVFPLDALAMPRFAVQQGVSCSACHANPTGGGARNPYGSGVFVRQILSANYGGEESPVPLVDGSIGENIQIGTDIRATYMHGFPRAIVPEERAIEEMGSFFLMQGDLYLTAQLGPHVSFYYDQGTYGSQEIFTMLHYGAATFKAGKFVPAYGWRIPDHTLYIREPQGFGPREKDTGVSMILDHPHATMEVGAFNGAGADSMFDRDMHRAYVGRFEARYSGDRLNLHLGSSGYLNVVGDGEERTRALRFGGFGGMAYGRLAYLFELDEFRDKPDRNHRIVGYAAFNELSLVVLEGVQLAGTYEFRDPNEKISDDGLHRLGVSLNLFPWQFFEFEVVLRQTIADPKSPVAGFIEGMVVLHAFL